MWFFCDTADGLIDLEEIEDYGFSIAINEGKTGEYIDTESLINELRYGSKDWQIF